MNALSGTGLGEEAEVLLLPELLPELPPPVVVPEPERDVPPCEVLALEEMLVLELVLESTVELADEVELEDNCDVELTLEVFEVGVVFAVLSAEEDEVDEEMPLLVVGCNNEVVAPLPPAPAPEEEPAVLEAVAGTVPADDACT